MNDWIAAAIAVAGGIVVGSIAGRVVQNALHKNRNEALRSAATPIGSLVFSGFLVAGLMTALGFVKKDALESIPQDLVDYLPNALSAAIVMILANVLAQLAVAALERTVARAPGAAMRRVPMVAKFVIMGFAVILAAAQLGIDTTIINIAVAALLFGLALAAALMTGLGSREVAAEVAAGRALRRLVSPGDRLITDDIQGTVVRIQSVGVEVETGDGSIVVVPGSSLVSETFRLERSRPTDES
ncbi:MAG: mechanosensitive ion channel [Acidimicrobiales bacterium]|nr:mechanosensitive ion channel [Acidimicrobiales bacterium]